MRLHGIDCPEVGQPFWRRAKEFTSEMVFGREVRIHVRDIDRYGRTVAEVIFGEDGRMLNRELVQAGLAWWYKQYAPYDSRIEELERDAREASRDLWSDGNAVAPWDWRRERR